MKFLILNLKFAIFLFLNYVYLFKKSQEFQKMLKLGVRTCDLIAELNMFYGTKPCHPNVQNVTKWINMKRLLKKDLLQETIKLQLQNSSVVAVLLIILLNWRKLGRMFEMFENAVQKLQLVYESMFQNSYPLLQLT